MNRPPARQTLGSQEIFRRLWKKMAKHERDTMVYVHGFDFTFRDATEEAGVAGRDGIGAGVSMVDIDNDGDLDIGWTNGHRMGPGADYLVEPFLADFDPGYYQYRQCQCSDSPDAMCLNAPVERI